MTKQQLRPKINELIRESNKEMRRRIESLLKSGAVDLTDYADDYRLPKIIVTALFREAATWYKPHDKKLREEVLNIQMFI